MKRSLLIEGSALLYKPARRPAGFSYFIYCQTKPPQGNKYKSLSLATY